MKLLDFVVKSFWESERDLLGEYQVIPIAQLQRSARRYGCLKTSFRLAFPAPLANRCRGWCAKYGIMVTARCFQLEEH